MSIRPFALAALLLNLGCIERASSARQERSQFDRSRLGELLLPAAPPLRQASGGIFGDAVRLLGYTQDPPALRPGQTARITFYFEVMGELDAQYKVFVHVDDPSGRAERINGDHWPAQGRYPSRFWKRGEIIRDEWSLSVPSYVDVDGLDLWTGLYLPERDERLPLTNRAQVRNDGNNRLWAGFVPLK